MNAGERCDWEKGVATERVSIPSSRGLIPAVVHRPVRSLAQAAICRGRGDVRPGFSSAHGAVPGEEVRSPEIGGFGTRGANQKVANEPGAVVCCHGLLSAKDSSKFVGMGNRLAERGLWAVRFDFTGCGENTSAFGPSLVATRLEDLRSVLDWVVSPHRPWGSTAALGLFGSSLGGFLSYVFSSTYPGRVRSLVLWSAPAWLRLIGAGSADRPPEMERIWPKGLPLGEPDAVDAVQPVPQVLIVHGMADELVPWEHAVGLYRHAAEEKRLVLLDGADHRLTDPEVRAMAMDVTVAWLAERLLPRDFKAPDP